MYELEETIEDLKIDRTRIERTIASLEDTEDALTRVSENEELIEMIGDELEKWKYELECLNETIDDLECELFALWEVEQKNLEFEYLKSCKVIN